MDKNTRYVCMIPFANHVTWQQTHHWLNLFVFSFFFFRRKANGDTNWYRLNAKISIANYSNHIETHKNSRSFFFGTSFHNYRTENEVRPFEKSTLFAKHIMPEQILCCLISFFRGMCVWFALHWMEWNGWRMIRIFIRIVDFESMWFFEFRLSLSFFIYMLSSSLE